jgi:Xaa-Pro dipeptidase
MDRLGLLRSRTVAEGCAACLVVNPVNIRYLTGYHSNAYSRPLGLFVPVDGEPTFLVPRLEVEQARVLTGIADVRDYVEWSDGSRAGGAPDAEWLSLLSEVLPANRRIAMELTPLTARIADVQPVDATGWVERLRIVKSPEEIANHRRAAELAGVGLDAALAAVQDELSEREIYATAAHAMLTRAAEMYPNDPVAVGGNAIVGARTASLHLPATGARPQTGDLVFVVLVASVGGSWCELSRTVVAGGSFSSEQARVFAAVARAFDAARACLQPGVVASDVDRAARLSLADDGLAEYQPMRTGHGLGISGGSEAPHLGAADTTPLEPGMVVSIEPSVCMPGFGGVCWADNFVITTSGAEQLSNYPVESFVSLSRENSSSSLQGSRNLPEVL